MDKEEKYRRIKDKRLKKHYSIQVGGVNMKIINQFFKRLKIRGEDAEYLILKSNIPFPYFDREEVTIRIKKEDGDLMVIGRFDYGVSSIKGVYELAFRVIRKL